MSPEELIDQLCDTFEAQWLNGEGPRIESFINQDVGDKQAALFYQLLLVELEYRSKQGEKPSREEYLQRFPQFTDQIEGAHFRFGSSAFTTSSGSAKDDSVRLRGRAPGSRIAHFELRELLGAGAMGEVWKAWDPQLQRLVAVKLPRVEGLSEGDMHRFLREGRAAAQLRHPQLAQIYAVGRAEDTAYIVSDYVDGENLRQFLENAQISKSAAADSATQLSRFAALADLCAEIAEALHHAHEQGIVHRDLKPANIIMDRAGRPHVIDFGLAKWSSDTGELTLQGDLLGTPAYMSPEQAGGNAAKLDRRTDVYSLGVILYELLCGQCPFTGDMGSVIHRIIAVDVPPVRKLNVKVPRDLETICIKALEKNPDRRYATMQEIAVDLRRFARGESILSRRPGLVERAGRWARRHPSLAAATLAMLLIVGLSGSTIYSLVKENYKLEQYVEVHVNTQPEGAQITFVPIDKRTGEPNLSPSEIKHAPGRTPLKIPLKAGDYLVEAVLPDSGNEPDFAEVTVSIASAELLTRWKGGVQTMTLDPIRILPTRDAIANMIAVPIDGELRRANPLLPEVLFVDANETALSGGSQADEANKLPVQDGISQGFYAALERVRAAGKRLPTAAEYDAIAKAANDHRLRFVATGLPATMPDLFGGLAEWTTTKYDFPGHAESSAVANLRSAQVLKGYNSKDALPGLARMPKQTLAAPVASQSPWIGFRGIRSGKPRFATTALE